MWNYGCVSVGFYVFIITVTPRNTRLFQLYSLIINSKEYSYYNLSEEAKFLLPDVTTPLQTDNILKWSTSPKHTRVQPVLHRCDLPSSAKWNILSLEVTAWSLELTKVIENILLLKIPLKGVCSLKREMLHTPLLKVITLHVTFSIYKNTVHG
jgi:hypothetical protein